MGKKYHWFQSIFVLRPLKFDFINDPLNCEELRVIFFHFVGQQYLVMLMSPIRTNYQENQALDQFICNFYQYFDNPI